MTTLQKQAAHTSGHAHISAHGGEHSEAQQRAGSAQRSEAAGAEERALDSSQINPPPLVLTTRVDRRQQWKRRARSAAFLAPLGRPVEGGYVKPVRPGSCSWTIGQGVGIWTVGGARASFTGLERCSSIWCCPCCSPVIRRGRAYEIETAVQRHQNEGGGLLFFTGTVKHYKRDSLERSLGAVLDAWGAMVKNAPWKKAKKKFNISGYIRSVEVTYGRHGWHPHIHALLFIDGELTDEAAEKLKAWLFRRWKDAAEKAGARRPKDAGLDAQKVDKFGKVIAKYISKVEGKKWTVGAELTRGDVKTGRDNEAYTPMELLDEGTPMDEKTRAKLWREFYTTTKGRRAITWSRGLKKRYDVEECDDDDLLDAEQERELVWATTARAYRALKKKGADHPAIALEYAEDGEWKKLGEVLPGFRGG